MADSALQLYCTATLPVLYNDWCYEKQLMRGCSFLGSRHQFGCSVCVSCAVNSTVNMWSLDEIAVGVIKAVNTNEFNEMRYGCRFNNLPRKSSFLSAAAGFAGLWAAIVQIVGGARDRPRKPPKKIPGLRTTHPFLPVLPLSHFSFSASYTVQHKRCWSVQHNDLESSSTVICCLYLKTGFGWSGGCFFSFHLFSQTRRVIQIVVRRSTAESWLHNSLVVFCTKLAS